MDLGIVPDGYTLGRFRSPNRIEDRNFDTDGEPIAVFQKLFLGVAHIFFIEKRDKDLEDFIIHTKTLVDEPDILRARRPNLLRLNARSVQMPPIILGGKVGAVFEKSVPAVEGQNRLGKPRVSHLKVGVDPAAAIDLAASIRMFHFAARRLRFVGASGVIVVIERARRIIALNIPPARCEILRCRECEAVAFADAIDRLHQAFAERGLADDQPAVVVLNSAGDDFGRRGAPPRNEHDERHLAVGARAIRVIVVIRAVGAPARVHYERALLEKLVRDGNGLIQQPAWVVAQVEHELSRAFHLKLDEIFMELILGRLRKIGDAQITGIVIEHERVGHTAEVDLVPDDGEVERLVVAGAGDRNRDLAAFGPA